VENDDLALDRFGINGTAILTLVERMNVSHVEIPLLDVRTDHAEPWVVHDPALLVCQRYGMLVQPRHLPTPNYLCSGYTYDSTPFRQPHSLWSAIPNFDPHSESTEISREIYFITSKSTYSRKYFVYLKKCSEIYL